MSKKLGQEPAFHTEYGFHKEIGQVSDTGMSKRFYAACAAMQGMLANSYLMEAISEEVKTTDGCMFFIVRQSYQYADELLKQENNE